MLVTLLATTSNADRGLDSADRENATLALTESDNAAIEALFSSLEQLRGGLVPASESIQAMFRRAGDTSPSSTRHLTTRDSPPTVSPSGRLGTRSSSIGRSPADASSMPRHRLRPRPDGDVTPSQRWGAGSAGYPPIEPTRRSKVAGAPLDGALSGPPDRDHRVGQPGLRPVDDRVAGERVVHRRDEHADRAGHLGATALDLGARQPPRGCSPGP